MAVSVSENPLDGWHLDWWDSGENLTDTSDYLTLGVHEKCIIACNSATRLDGSSYANVSFYDAEPMADGKSGHGWRIWNLACSNGSAPNYVQPVVHHGKSQNLYLTAQNGDGLQIWGVNAPLTKAQAVVTFATVPLTAMNPPVAAPQKGSSRKLWFDYAFNWVMTAIYRSGSICVAMSDAVDWFNDGQLLTSVRVASVPIEFGSLQTRTSIDRVFGKNNVFDDKPSDRYYYGYPALDVNKNGDIVVVYSRSGTEGYPQARYSAWPAGDSDISPSRLLKAGDKAYSSAGFDPPGWTLPTLPWADIAGVCVDPVDDTAIWIATCYATGQAKDNWGVWVGKICPRTC
jgi:hypothetical protein